MVKEYKHLTPEDVEFFLENGYLVVKHAFSREQAAEFTKDMWTRLGMDPNDKSTWVRERTNMPSHTRVPVSEFAPKAWNVIVELLGGEDRIDPDSSAWGDSFIVNLGTAALEARGCAVPPTELDNWHVDGDFFVHFLDSPEQALLVVPLFSDIAPMGGGTYVAPEGIAHTARYLAAHPEGVVPGNLAFVPAPNAGRYASAEEARGDPGFHSHLAAAARCTRFVELTGEVGDVVVMHPLMLHSASRNVLRVPRVITNPPVALRAPFCFARAEGEGEGEDGYSLVERKTLRALGVERLEFALAGPRRRIVPTRVEVQAKMLEDEKRRLEAARRREVGPESGLSAVGGGRMEEGGGQPIAVA